ncbi:hypothetical protein ACVBR5_000942 [Burkholderia cenocepacia]
MKTMRKCLFAAAAALLLTGSEARADSWFQFEAGIGASIYTKQGDGIYYNEGFDHHTQIVVPAFRAGIVLTPINAEPHSWRPGLRLHAAYLNLGKISWGSQSPQDATDFTDRGMRGGYDPATKGCIDNNCGQMSDFQSYGRIQALAFTVEPYWNLGTGWTVGIEAGPAFYRTTWMTHATVETPGWKLGPPGTVHMLSTRPTIHVGVLTGLSLSKGHFGVRYNYIFAPHPSGPADDDQVPGVKGAHMVTVNYTF